MRQSKEEKEKQDRIAGGFAIGVFAILLGLINLAFIIPDLIFAHQQSDCVRTGVPNISLTLDSWLKVDAYVRIGLMATLLIIAIFFCLSKNVG